MRRGDKSQKRYLRRAAGFVRRAGVSGFNFGLAACAVLGSMQIQQNFNASAWISAAEAHNDDWQKDARRQQRQIEQDAKRADQEARRAQQEAKRAEQEARRQQIQTEQEAKRLRREMEQEARHQRHMTPRSERIDVAPPDVSRIERRHDDAGSRQQEVKPESAVSPVTSSVTGVNSNKPDDTSRRRDDGKDNSSSGKNKSAAKTDEKTTQDIKKSPRAKTDQDIDDFEKPLPPPRTVLEMFERIGTPEKPKAQPAPVAAPAAIPVKNLGIKTAAPPNPAIPKVSSKPVAKPIAAVKRGAPDFELLQQGMFRPHEIIATNLSPAEQKFAEANGFKTVSTVQSPGVSGTVSSLIVPPGMSEAAAVQFLESAAPSALFGPNHVYRIVPAADGPVPAAARDGLATAGPDVKKSEGGAAVSADCSAGACFARDLLAWKPATKQCARRVRVGLIDTSFDVSHPAFAGRKFSLERFSGSQAIARGDWHGTAVLSVLAGNASSSTPGLIPDADFFLASTFRADAQGNAAADTISVLKALAWLDKNNINIVNMSFSGPRNDQIEAAIVAMAAKGVVFVAAAGNKGPSAPPSYPAAYPQVVAVTAVGKKLNSYLHANRGDYVDVAAPGVQVLTALPEGRQGYRTGTSFATPFITGLLAAMPAVRKGATDKEEMLSRISFQDLGEPGRDTIYGEGLPKAPERCNDIGGVASLPWTNAAKRMSVGAPAPAESALARPASQ